MHYDMHGRLGLGLQVKVHALRVTMPDMTVWLTSHRSLSVLYYTCRAENFLICFVTISACFNAVRPSKCNKGCNPCRPSEHPPLHPYTGRDPAGSLPCPGCPARAALAHTITPLIAMRRVLADDESARARWGCRRTCHAQSREWPPNRDRASLRSPRPCTHDLYPAPARCRRRVCHRACTRSHGWSAIEGARTGYPAGVRGRRRGPLSGRVSSMMCS